MTDPARRAAPSPGAPAALTDRTAGSPIQRERRKRILDATLASDEDKAIARVIGDVWLSNLVAWVTRRASAEDVEKRLELTVRLLLRSRQNP
jgi:hypothetical protein